MCWIISLGNAKFSFKRQKVKIPKAEVLFTGEIVQKTGNINFQLISDEHLLVISSTDTFGAASLFGKVHIFLKIFRIKQEREFGKYWEP